MTPEEAALSYFKTAIRPEPEFDILSGSIMELAPTVQPDVIEESFFQPDDILPWNALKGLLGLALAGTIKPVSRSALAAIDAYAPKAVQAAKARAIEPVFESAALRALGDDAVTFTKSPELQILTIPNPPQSKIVP